MVVFVLLILRLLWGLFTVSVFSAQDADRSLIGPIGFQANVGES